MSRMNSAWSNEPPWAEAVPAIFKEPMTIAFGGAILAHAIFFLGLPVVAGSEKQPDVQPVATTVLTDQERAAVPADLSQSQFSTGSLLPGSNNGLIVPSIPSNPATPGGTVTTPGLGSGFGQINEPAFSNGGYSSSSNSSDNSDFNTRLAEITRQQEAQKSQQQAKEKNTREAAIEAKINEENKTKPLKDLPPVAVDPTKFPPSSSDGTQQTAANPATNPTTPPTIKPSPEPSDEESIKKRRAALYALNNKEGKTGPELGGKVQTTFFTWTNEANSKQKNLLTRSKKPPVKLPNVEIPYPTKIEDQSIDVIPDYAQRVQDGFGEALLAIGINEQGNFEFEPSIIQSSGYPILDQYAISYVRSLMKNSKLERTIQLYILKVKITPPNPPAQ
jgi:outer membrane biosynthesis protein TonB